MSNKNLPDYPAKKMKIIGLIQARMGSQRLKNKALLKIGNQTITEIIFNRLKSCEELDDIILSTSSLKENDILAKHAETLGLKYYRGSEEDVLSRHYQAAKKFKADAVVKITGDCPLVDPELVDKMVKIYRKNYNNIDFLTNAVPPTFPDGLDIDIIPFSTLEKSDKEIKTALHRGFFTVYIVENPELFKTYNFSNPVDFSSMRWTLDYSEDLIFIKKIFDALGKNNKIFTMKDTLNLLEKNPELLEINANRIDKTIIAGIRSNVYHALKAENK